MKILEIAELELANENAEVFKRDRIELHKILIRIFEKYIKIDVDKIYTKGIGNIAYYTIEDITMIRNDQNLCIYEVNGNKVVPIINSYPKILFITDIAKNEDDIEKVRNFKAEPTLITENKI